MKRLSDSSLLSWLEGRVEEGSDATGFDASGWEASTWILHAMYETDAIPAGLTHDDVYRAERAAGLIERPMVGEVDLDELMPEAVVIGSPLGRSGWPGQGWRRLRWHEYARRLDVKPFASGVAPGHRSFPHRSWPATIAPPGEGSLDREQFVRLLGLLAAATVGGMAAECTAFYGMCASGDFDEPVLFTGRLAELVGLYDEEDLPGSPSNVWSSDLSWFVYTDWDLWGTKISGAHELIDALQLDDVLETVQLTI